MSATQHLAEVLTRHQIFLERYANGKVKQVRPIIESLRVKILNLFLGKELSKNDLVGLEIALNQINTIIGIEKEGFKRAIDQTVNEVVDYEAGFYGRALGTVATVETAGIQRDLILAAVRSKPMQLVSGSKVKTVTLETAADVFSDAVASNVINTIRVGILNNETQSNIARAITSSMRTRSVRQATTLARTVINHTTAQTRDNINSQLFPDYNERFVATLDSHTTITCASKDGLIFKRGEGPQPPLHYGCRSLRVVVIDPAFAVPGFEGERPSVVNGNVEIVSGNTTYTGFLKNQSEEFQNEVLGPERAALFRSGKVPLRNFTDDSGRVLTIDELKAMEGLTL